MNDRCIVNRTYASQINHFCIDIFRSQFLCSFQCNLHHLTKGNDCNIGTRYSPSGTIPFSPYICSLSMKITGSLSRMELFNKPFASEGLLGITTFKPGQFAYQFSKACECWLLNIPAEAVGPRKTIGTVYCPPLMLIILAAELITWSIATSEKLKVMNSMIGRSPFMAAPTPIPAKPSSDIGVSITLLSPNSSSIP